MTEPVSSDDHVVMGIDIGGTGIKGAPVDVLSGKLLADRCRILTPKPATPKAVANVVADVIDHFQWNGPVGATFPAVVKDGITLTAANVDREWIGTDADKILTDRLGMPVLMLNDADAAGIAEIRFGAGKGRDGVVVMITLGTGIGCGMFQNGVLIPNTEFGHIQIDGKDAEKLAADSVRERKGLSWKDYAARVQRYIRTLDALIWPDLVILGGGASKNADKLLPRLDVRPEVVAARLLNDAGIVGAAVMAAEGRP